MSVMPFKHNASCRIVSPLGLRQVDAGMTKPPSIAPALHHCKRRRFTVEIIAHAVRLYYPFPLSLRHVEDLLATVSTHE